jgi:DNA-binding XRE family transcriptional regulator
MIRGKKYRLHRVSYEQFNGPIPKGKRICHHCDNPRCVNPEHLYVGDARTNALDVVDREGSSLFKLKKSDVENIKELFQAGGYSMGRLARLYGVTPGTICHIIHNKTWVGVGPDLWNGEKRVEVLCPGKLNREQVVEIRDLLAAGVSQTEIASRYGVSRRSVYAIREGETWRE